MSNRNRVYSKKSLFYFKYISKVYGSDKNIRVTLVCIGETAKRGNDRLRGLEEMWCYKDKFDGRDDWMKKY